jgi:polyhydroxybutyrate depolymerase
MRWPGLLLTLLLAPPAQAAGPDPVVTLQHQGIARQAILHRPPGNRMPRPLVIALHGLNQPAAELQAALGLDAVADREGFATAYPSAVIGRWSYTAERPVVLPGGGGLLDDTGFLAALVDRLVAEQVADPAAVFVTGQSRGGLLAWTLACEAAGRYAAIAPLITGMTGRQLTDCAPARPVPLLLLAGTGDRVQPYDGWLYAGYRLVSVPETLEFWRRQLGCSGQASRLLPHRQAADPTRAAIVDWSGCAPGTGLRFLRVEGGGHRLPSLGETQPLPGPASAGLQNQDFDTAEEIWRFFGGYLPQR